MDEKSNFTDTIEIGFEEELIRLRADTRTKTKFSSLSLTFFWASQLQTYSTVLYDGIEISPFFH